MKKKDLKLEQLNISFSVNNPQNNSQEPKDQPIEGKQVYLNPRQEIYNKILNRKME